MTQNMFKWQESQLQKALKGQVWVTCATKLDRRDRARDTHTWVYTDVRTQMSECMRKGGILLTESIWVCYVDTSVSSLWVWARCSYVLIHSRLWEGEHSREHTRRMMQEATINMISGGSIRYAIIEYHDSCRRAYYIKRDQSVTPGSETLLPMRLWISRGLHFLIYKMKEIAGLLQRMTRVNVTSRTLAVAPTPVLTWSWALYAWLNDWDIFKETGNWAILCQHHKTYLHEPRRGDAAPGVASWCIQEAQ